mmetsp:Transcript_9960/g.30833  ORF Transcript_9960/g.30833 Transcript_9960/m.30833 type:complete len:359 (-) Transcript_9960:158-1234(-)
MAEGGDMAQYMQYMQYQQMAQAQQATLPGLGAPTGFPGLGTSAPLNLPGIGLPGLRPSPPLQLPGMGLPGLGGFPTSLPGFGAPVVDPFVQYQQLCHMEHQKKQAEERAAAAAKEGLGPESAAGSPFEVEHQTKIDEMCKKFSLDLKIKGRLCAALYKRMETINEDLQELFERLEVARYPPGLCCIKIREMEEGVFFKKGSGPPLKPVEMDSEHRTDCAALASKFGIDDRLRHRLEKAMSERSSTFKEDIKTLEMCLDDARYPPALLTSKLNDLEKGMALKRPSGKGGAGPSVYRNGDRDWLGSDRRREDRGGGRNRSRSRSGGRRQRERSRSGGRQRERSRSQKRQRERSDSRGRRR